MGLKEYSRKPAAKAKAPRRSPATKNNRAKPEQLTGEAFAPELCKSQSSPPAGDNWLHEVKWDGYRLLATVVGGKVRLWSRNAIEWTEREPDIAKAIASLKLKGAQIDGELIVLHEGRSDFNRLQARLSGETRDALTYMLFDLPHLNGLSLRDTPLIERKTELARLLGKRGHDALRYSEHTIGNGATVFAQALSAGLEGVISKKIDSPYRGARNGDWIKAKARASDEFVVIGYTEPKGSRSGIGALLLGKPVEGGYRYVGRVGTGFSSEHLRELRKAFKSAVTEKEPADITLLPRADRKFAIWVKPASVVEVFYQGIGGQGLLRQPAFKTFREDKRPADLKSSTESAVRKRVAQRKKTAT